MKIVAWNLGHQTRERPIKPHFLDVIKRLQPDVVTLNEYVHGNSREKFLRELASAGLSHHRVSNQVSNHNQVLVLTREPIDNGDLTGPAVEGGGGESNFLHVKFTNSDLEIVGLRAPAYGAKVLQDYWVKLADLIRSSQSRKIIFLGDFNADPDLKRHHGARHLTSLRSEGWKIPSPLGPWSYIAGTRIDHALASPGAINIEAEYLAEFEGFDLASRSKATRISDHAALVVRVTGHR
jgi:exonuclease III